MHVPNYSTLLNFAVPQQELFYADLERTSFTNNVRRDFFILPQVGSGNSCSNFPSADLTGSPEPGLLGKKSNVKLTICAKSDIQNAQLFSFPFYCRLSVLCTVHTFWSRTAFNRRIGMKEVKKVPMAMQLFSGIG